jgi:hypothetical protein
MVAETKHVIVLEINEEHRVQIKNSYYCCIYRVIQDDSSDLKWA